MQPKTVGISLVVAVAMALGLAACSDKGYSPTAGRSAADSNMAEAPPQRQDPAKGPAMPDPGAQGPVAGADAAKDASKDAAAPGASPVSDAVITSAVKAELAKDPKLSTLPIQVDAAGGRVALKGTAPDAATRDKATQVASAVKGVVSVDNQLTVGTS